MKSKSEVKKTSSRITKEKGVKRGGKKNKMNTKRNVGIDTKSATRTKVTSVRRPKTSRSRQTRQRRKTALKKDIVVKRSSGRVEKFDTNRLAQTVSRSGVPFLMARDIAKKATKKIKSQIMSPARQDIHMNKKNGKENCIPRTKIKSKTRTRSSYGKSSQKFSCE